jgi:hypothetical protein
MIALWFLAGCAVEGLNTWVRKWNVGALGAHSAARVWPGLILGFVFRLVGTAMVLVFAFRCGLACGVAALLGYWLCRWVIVWRIHRRLE